MKSKIHFKTHSSFGERVGVRGRLGFETSFRLFTSVVVALVFFTISLPFACHEESRRARGGANACHSRESGNPVVCHFAELVPAEAGSRNPVNSTALDPRFRGDDGNGEHFGNSLYKRVEASGLGKFLFTPAYAVPQEIDLAHLDKTGWFDCINRDGCADLSNKFHDKMEQGHHGPENALAASLSSLLGLYLRGEGDVIDLNIIESANELIDTNEYGPASVLVKAMIGLVMGDNEGAQENMNSLNENEKKTASARLIIAFSLEKNGAEFNRYSASVLNESFVPSLAMKLGNIFLRNGQCSLANPYLDKLMKKYAQEPLVVSMWAASKMDCDEFSGGMYAALKRGRKVLRVSPPFVRGESEGGRGRGKGEHAILAQMIRYLNHRSDDKEIKTLVSSIDANSLEGASGSSLFTEWARFLLKKGNDVEPCTMQCRAEAETFLRHAVALDPKNASAHRMLGQFYLAGKKDIPRAIASLKSYIHLAPTKPDAVKMKDLVSNLERETKLYH